MTNRKKNRCYEYANYYMEARFRFTWHDGDYVEAKLDYIAEWGFNFGYALATNIPMKEGDRSFEIGDIRKDGIFQLFLLHSSELNCDQLSEYHKLCIQYVRKDNKMCYADTPESLEYLLKNYVDCFNLLNDGSALHLSIVNALP